MKARLITGAIGASDTRVFAQTDECLFQDLDGHRRAPTQGEEGRVSTLGMTRLFSLRGVLRQCLIQL